MFLILACAIAAVGLAGTGMAPVPQTAGPAAVEIKDGTFQMDGARFLVKGIHYSPWPPGSGPMKSHAWPDDSLIESDLRTIRELGANSIHIHDAPPRLLDQAAASGLQVVYTFFLNWQSIGDDTIFSKRSDEIVATVQELASRRNLIGVLLGNEIIEWVYKQRGRTFIEGRLKELYERIMKVAPHVLVSRANWPVSIELDLSLMDCTALKLYPTGLREVVAHGDGNYILTPFSRSHTGSRF